MLIGKGGKNRRRGKNENEDEKRELVFKEDGQGERHDVSEIDWQPKWHIHINDSNAHGRIL